MLLEREKLEAELVAPIAKVKRGKRKTSDIKKHLYNVNQISEGFVQGIINDPETELPLIDDSRILCLITEQVYAKTGDESINPTLYFTEKEIKHSHQYSGKLDIRDEIKLPLTLENVTMFDTDTFHLPMTLEMLADLSRSRLIQYNFDIQRESVKRRIQGEIIQEAKLIMKNVVEIKNNLKSYAQERTSLVINAETRSSDEGDELIYDPSKRTLTITKGTILDIVDGYHRIKATELAVSEKPEIKNFTWGVWITNYTDDRAKNYQGQLAKGTPIAKERQEFLSSSRNSDLVIKELKLSSELKGRISDTNRVHTIANEVVSYRVLKDAIEEQFKLDSKKTTYEVADYLKVFFDFLLGTYEEEFITNPEKSRKESIVNSNNMFYGYIVLARRMMEEGLSPREVDKYLTNIDFSKKNKEWVELDILDSKGNFYDTKKARDAIKRYFEGIEL